VETKSTTLKVILATCLFGASALWMTIYGTSAKYTANSPTDCIAQQAVDAGISIDWQYAKSILALESCLMNFSDGNSDTVTVQRLLQNSGFRVEDAAVPIPAAIIEGIYGVGGGGNIVTGKLDKSRIPLRMSLMARLFSHGLSVQVLIGENGEILNTNVGFDYL
jgi:hypothetical protein